MKNLNEGKNRKPNYMAELAEIDAQSAIVAMEAKIGKLEEMAKAKEQRLEMVSEDENLSELISKSAVKEMQKEIKEIRKMQEKLKKVYEKKNGKKTPEMVDEEMPPSADNMDLDKAVYGLDAERDPATGNIKEATIKVGDKVDVKPGVIDDFPSDQYVYNVNVEKINGDKLTVKDINNDEYEVSISDVEGLNEASCGSSYEEDDTNSMNEEFLRMQKLAGVISEEEYKKKLNEEVSPQIAAGKAIKTLATKLEKAPEMDKLAAQVAKNPKLMAQLEKAVKDAGVNVELAEDESGLDMADMKTMALNLAKKSKSVNEKQEYLDDDDGSLDVGLGMASFVGGGSLGAAFGSAIVSAVPAVTSIFAGPALLGAAAGVGLFLLARKAYLSGQNNPIEF